MKCFVSFVCFLSVLVFVSAAPFFPAGGSFGASTSLQLGATSGTNSGGGGANGLTNILSNIDLPGLLRGVNSFVKLVGVFCPPLSQVLDNVIQNVTSTAFRVFGSAILRSGGLGGGGSGGGQRVSVVLPTFPPDDDEDEDEDTDVNDASDSGSAITSSQDNFNADVLSRSGSETGTTTESSKISEPLVLSRDKEEISSSSASFSSSSDNDENSNDAISVSEIKLPARDTEEVSNSESTTSSETNGEDVNVTTLYTSPVNEDSNAIAKRHVRVTREAAEEVDDQEGAESALQPAEDIASVDDQDRNKRFLPFGGGHDGHAEGGSGNFLFDIIRNTADRAARTVGTVYRMVAGTENLGLTATSESAHIPFAIPAVDAGFHASLAAPSPFSLSALSAKLVAGSGATEEHDDKANSPGGVAELDIQKSHEAHYSGEGIPGPITRLFVIANRGLANLVQDLILRLAATSEKIVNFKARLITSLI